MTTELQNRTCKSPTPGRSHQRRVDHIQPQKSAVDEVGKVAHRSNSSRDPRVNIYIYIYRKSEVNRCLRMLTLKTGLPWMVDDVSP